MKLDGWIFNAESTHPAGVQLTFARSAARTPRGKIQLTCKREEVKTLIGDLRPGDFVEISIAPGTVPPTVRIRCSEPI